MRVLVVASPGTGHVFPLVPVSWALRSEGHDVLVASAGDGVQRAASAGLTAVAFLLSLLLTRTRFGRSVRATVQNPTAATLLGVDANRVQTLSFGLGVSMAAAAGAVYGVIYPFNPGSHYDLISRLLSIVVLGGLGSLGGAVAAALGMGVIEAIVAVEISPIWASFSFFIVLLVFLLLRPQGIFGLRERTL